MHDVFTRTNFTAVPSVAMTLGSGVQWHEAYSAANDSGRILVGGASAGGSVGAAGGWLQGGGHSALAPSYGLGELVPSSNRSLSPDLTACAQVSTTCSSSQ